MNKRSGFTIVELLIVIVVIAVLAAITIVAYNGIQDRARNSAAASSSSQASKKIKVWQVDNELTTPSCAQFYTLVTNATDSTSCSFNFKDTNYQYTAGTGGAFCVTTTVVNKSYKVSESTTPTSGGCAGHGQNGVAAIPNLVANPSAETNANIWTQNNATFARSSEQFIQGGFSFKIIPSTTNTYSGMYISDPGVNGQTYTYSAYVYSLSTQAINFAADGAGVNATVNVGPIWQRLTLTGTRSSANPLHVRAVGTGGIAFYVDGIMMTQGSTTYAYADGSSANWAWTGTAHNSTSTGPPL